MKTIKVIWGLVVSSACISCGPGSSAQDQPRQPEAAQPQTNSEYVTATGDEPEGTQYRGYCDHKDHESAWLGPYRDSYNDAAADCNDHNLENDGHDAIPIL